MEEEREEAYEYYDPDTQLSSFWTAMTKEKSDEDPCHSNELPADPVATWLAFYATERTTNDQSHELKADEDVENKFVEYWRLVVPLLLAPHNRQTSMDINKKLGQSWDEDDNELNNKLLRPLLRFLANDEKQLEDKLRGGSEPSAICGRQLEYGEPIYLCRDCGADNTVVLCSRCFQASEHRKHHYRMFVSEGGGFCDCGEHEAFLSPFYYCNHHLPSNAESKREDQDETAKESQLDPQLLQKASHLFKYVCRYVIEVTSCRRKMEELSVGQKEVQLFPLLKYPFQFNSHCLLLINDSSHTYQDVSSVLKLCLNCDPKLASNLTELVDKEGRAVITVGSFKDCAAVRDKIESKRGLGSVLKTLILPTYIVSHQLFATLILEWLAKVLKSSADLRRCFGEIFFSEKTRMPKRKYTGPVGNEDKSLFSIAEIVMLSDAFVWKEVRKAWVNLVVESVFKDYQLKLTFTTLFVRHYHSIVLDFIHDDQESDASITRLTVQLFTIKSIAQRVIEREDAFYRLVCLFKDLLTEHEEDGVLRLEPWMGEERAEFLKAETILTDLTYLLQLPPTDGLSDEGRRSFTRGVDAFVSLLSHLQQIDKQKRQSGLHVEFESQEWEHVRKLMSSLSNISDLIHKWCGKDKGLVINVYSLILTACHKRPKLATKEKELKFQKGGHKYTVSELNILADPVSVHVPMQRFLAGLLPLFNNFDIEFALNLRRRTDDSLVDFMASVVDPVITAVATLSSIQAGMWKRNGTPAQAQAYIYHHANICPSLKRQDLLLLQAAVGLVGDPGRFIFTIIQRFKLISWAGGEPEARRQGIGVLSADFVHTTNRMAERFLSLVLAIVYERHYEGVAKRYEFTQLDEIRHRLVHVLASADLPHSKVMDKLHLEHSRCDVKATQLDALLREVGHLRPSPKDPSKRVYELKREYERCFNPAFYFYSSEDMTKAIERRMEAKRKNKDRLVAPPPTMPNLSVVFSHLPRVCSTLPILRIIQITLARASSKDHPNKLVTSLQLSQVLLLLTQGYVDDLRRHSNEFTVAAESSSLFTLLKSLYELQTDATTTTSHCRNKVTIADEFKTPDLKELVLYTLERGNEARQLLLKVRVAPQTRAVTAMQSGSKATTTSTTPSSSMTTSEEAAATKKGKAEARKHQLMAEYKRMQSRFADQHASVLENVANTNQDKVDTMTTVEKKHERPIAVGPHRIRTLSKPSRFTCILCQEDGEVDEKSDVNGCAKASEALVSACYVHKTSIFGPRNNWSDSKSLREAEDVLLCTETMRGPMISSCGHVMHAKCYQQFFDSVEAKQRVEQGMYRHMSNFNAFDHEFLCPICERICNCVLPLLPSIRGVVERIQDDGVKNASVSFQEWLQTLSSLTKNQAKTYSLQRGGFFWDHYCTFVVCGESEINERYVCECTLVKYGTMTRSGTELIRPDFQALQREWRKMMPNMASDMTSAFIMNIFTKSLDRDPCEMDPRLITQPLASLSITLQLQLCLKHHHPSIMRALSERELDTLRFLTRVSIAHPTVSKDLQPQLHSLVLFHIDALLRGPHSSNRITFAHIDALFLMVLLMVTLSTLPIDKAAHRSIDYHEGHIVRLCFVLHLLQCCLSFDPSQPSPNFVLPSSPEEKDEEACVRSIMYKALKSVDRSAILDGDLQQSFNASRWLKYQMMRFVRGSALLCHFISNVDFPEQEHFDYLCAYIGLGNGNLKTIIDDSGVQELLNTWLMTSGSRKQGLIMTPSQLRHLISLPDDYSTLMDTAATFKCPSNEKGLCRFPSMCLVCGTLLCAQCTHCRFKLSGKMVGACSAHSNRCGADAGLFLNLRQCQIIIHLNQKRGVICAAPYVDRNGETDLGLKRGNPMRFDPALYEDLKRIWITNDMPNTIARSFDPDTQIIRADWHTL